MYTSFLWGLSQKKDLYNLGKVEDYDILFTSQYFEY